MSLPNPGMDFTAYQTLTATEMDNLVENIEALADGSGLDNSAVTPAKLLTGTGSSWVWQSWTPTLGGWSSNPTGGLYYYTVVGKMCTVNITQPNNGTSNATTCTFTLPLTSRNLTSMTWTAPAKIVDNGSNSTTPGMARVQANSSTLTVYKDFAFNAFTASGNKRVDNCILTYEIA